MDGQVRCGVTGSEAPAHEDGAGPSERPGVCEGDSAQVGLCKGEEAAAEGDTCEGPRVRLDLIAYRFLEVVHEAKNRTEEVDWSVDRRLAARAGRRHMVLSAWEAVSAATIRDGANLAGVPQALVSQVKPRGPVPRDEQSPPPREVLSAVDAESGHDRGLPGHKRRRKRHALEAVSQNEGAITERPRLQEEASSERPITRAPTASGIPLSGAAVRPCVKAPPASLSVGQQCEGTSEAQLDATRGCQQRASQNEGASIPVSGAAGRRLHLVV